MTDDIDEIVRWLERYAGHEPQFSRAAEIIKRLKERCEAYKGQVRAGAAEIERLKAMTS